MLVMAPAAAFAGDPLTIGSPAPPLQLAVFLKGEPVTELRKGSVYAIEFSGINCAPCIRAMPLLTELEKKRPAVTLISVYSENEEEVRDHLAKHDAEIGYRVALDDDFVMDKTWMRAARVQGIPAVFLIDTEGIIAWIGNPTELDDQIENLRDGTLDRRLERMRLSFQQANVEAGIAWFERRDKSTEEWRRLRALLEERKWAEVIQGAEQAARDYSPDDWFEFLRIKLDALASNPETTDEALKFAAELSAIMTYSTLGDLGKERSGTFDPRIAQSLLTDGENDDSILTEAATLLLRRAEAGLENIKDEDERFWRRKYINQILAMVDAQKKDFTAAAKRMRETLKLIRDRQCPAEIPPEDREQWERDKQYHIASVEADLAEYVKAAETDQRRP